MFPPLEMTSPDGYDLQFMTNVIGPFFFTKLLTPAVLAAKDTHPDHHSRIIMTSSSGAYLYTLNFDTFKDSPARRKMTTQNLYFQTKFVRGSCIESLDSELSQPPCTGERSDIASICKTIR